MPLAASQAVRDSVDITTITPPTVSIVPNKRFISAVLEAMEAEGVAGFVRMEGSGVDGVTVAHAVILLYRACVLPGEMKGPVVLAAIWLAMKYNDHPACSDELPEYVCAVSNAETERERRAATADLSHGATKLWVRLGMRCIVTKVELDAVLFSMQDFPTATSLPSRRDIHSTLWTAMRKWVGLAYKNRIVNLPKEK